MYAVEEDSSRRRHRDRRALTPEARPVDVKRRQSESPEVPSKRGRMESEGDMGTSMLASRSEFFKASINVID